MLLLLLMRQLSTCREYQSMIATKQRVFCLADAARSWWPTRRCRPVSGRQKIPLD